jgi:hypothetical protein
MPNVLGKLEYYRQPWIKAMPNVPPPEDERIISWIGEFSDKTITYGILRCQRKFRTRPGIEPEEHHRYAGGVMFHEQKLLEEKMQQALQDRQEIAQ